MKQSRAGGMMMTPLMTACANGHFATAALLVEAKANLEARVGKGREEETALTLACRMGHGDIADLLVQNGAQGEERARNNFGMGQPCQACGCICQGKRPDGGCFHCLGCGEGSAPCECGRGRTAKFHKGVLVPR
jgi:hypothetical protein